ncbi:hypothetical protein Tco_0486575 [Tanacetum coccineum]
MDYVKKSIEKRALHKMEYDSRDRITRAGYKQQIRNDAHVVDLDIRPIYNEEPMAEVQTTAKINVFAIGQQHTEQPEINNEGEVDQNAEQCHDTCPLPATLTDNQTTELLNQSLEYENIRLKKTVAQFQKDFLRMEAHCVNLELKYQNQALKEGQHGQFSKVKSNEAKVKHDIDITRAKSIEHTTSLIATNDKFKAQIQEKGFAVAALKNELRKLTEMCEILCFKTINLENGWTTTQKTNPFTYNHLPKGRESAPAKPHHMIAPSSSRPRSSMFKRCLIAADQASVFMVMTSVHISSGLVLHQMTSDHNRSELGIHDHSNEPSSSKLVPKVVPLAVKTATSRKS